MYTQLRNNKKANTFVFEGEFEDLGWAGRLAVSKGSATPELMRIAELAGIKRKD